MEPKVLVGIGTFEKFGYVEEHCIKKILAQDYKNFDVLLLDNSKDMIHYMTLKQKFPTIKVEHIKRPKYFRDALREMRQYITNYAVNYGYDYLLFVDVDHLLEKNTLSKLISHKKDFCTAVIGYMHQDYSTCYLRDWEEKLPSYVPGMPPLKPIYYSEMKDLPTLTEIYGCGLACALIKVPVLIGMEFYVTHKQNAFMEDVIFCADLRKKGVKMFLDTTTKPVHLHVMMAQRAFRSRS